MTELVDLPDHCLIMVFNYCEIDTLVDLTLSCKRIKTIVETYNIPKITEYRYTLCDTATDKAIIKRVGKQLRKLSVNFDFDFNETSVRRYCEFLVKHVGKNIRNLKIESSGESIPPLELLATILERLEELELSFCKYDGDASYEYGPEKQTYMVDLAALCPNLEKLLFHGINRLWYIQTIKIFKSCDFLPIQT